MFGLTFWDILGIIALLLLVVSLIDWRHSTWRGVILGLLISIMAIVTQMLSGNPVTWELPKKILIVSILVGGIFQIIGRFSKLMKNKRFL